MSIQVEPLYDKEITCLVCEKKYFTKRIRSRFIRTKKIESDFFTVYKDLKCNPYYYEVHVCPNCGFAASEHFSNYFPPGTKEKVNKELSLHWKERNFGNERTIDEAIATYKIAIFSATLKSEKHIVLAGLCLRLGWLYRIKRDIEQEKRFLRLALKEYENSYALSDFVGTQLTEIRVLYLLGELNRRVGSETDAVKYFSKVIQHRTRNSETKVLEMAREQWYLIRNREENVVIR
ncbi:DUF2225 domain-containing protein [Alkalihalobacillus sp. BA299]|uniref:DUF2225 domain-containing protein n=1 Tax=Alkalihalobacillus sp. BA299 TaxID=2815938 RepID=UPI001ADAF2D0